MDLDTTVTAQYARSTIVWRDLDALIAGTGRWDPDKIAPAGDLQANEPPWCHSLMNPAARINSEGSTSSIWRLDDFGRLFYAWPAELHPPIHPSYVTVTIPDSSLWPPTLPQILQSSASVHTRTDRVVELGIGRHVIQALDNWSQNIEDFDTYYRNLPFGSRISIKNVAPRPQDMGIKVNPPSSTFQALTIANLEAKFNIPVQQLPPRKRPEDFQMVKQLNEVVSVVNMTCGSGRDDTLILKASIEHLSRIYCELGTLLVIPNHPHLVNRPMYLLETTVSSRSEPVIVGFVLEHHVEGSLRDVLLREKRLGVLDHHEKLRWSKQLTSTLIDLRKEGKLAYRDLKTENLVLKKDYNDRRDIAIIDFENHGAPDSWTPPEVVHIENLRLIVQASNTRTDRQQYRDLLASVLRPNPTRLGDEDFSGLTSQSVWDQVLSPREQEAVQVFGLGMVFYCIFEGVGCPTSRISDSSGSDAAIQYPEFHRTPNALKRLILECTAGSKLGDSRAAGLVRCGDKLYPRGLSGQNGERLGNLRDIISHSRQMWLHELQAIRHFVPSRTRYQQCSATTEDINQLPYLSRPRLQDVLETLDNIQCSSNN